MPRAWAAGGVGGGESRAGAIQGCGGSPGQGGKKPRAGSVPTIHSKLQISVPCSFPHPFFPCSRAGSIGRELTKELQLPGPPVGSQLPCWILAPLANLVHYADIQVFTRARERSAQEVKNLQVQNATEYATLNFPHPRLKYDSRNGTLV
uniref:Uncharacterized protein n=1 Tax=Terrapene triunguis TaxID=2587831 RepID=A0A674IL81_9SAUR